MTDTTSVMPDLERLDLQLDQLEDALEPLLSNMDETAARLPLLDKAKLFSLTAYAIESLLFSSLRLQGVNAQEHAVYAELKRTQQYFGKIQKAEQPSAQRTLAVDKEATARILKASLGGGDKALGARLAEKIAAERAKALLKAVESQTRPADNAQPAASPGNGEQCHHARKSSKRRRSAQARSKE